MRDSAEKPILLAPAGSPQALKAAVYNGADAVYVGGRLFGAVTSKEIAEGLKAQYGVDIPKQKIVLDEPIKAYGSYQVKAKLGFEVSGTVYVTVCEEK